MLLTSDNLSYVDQYLISTIKYCEFIIYSNCFDQSWTIIDRQLWSYHSMMLRLIYDCFCSNSFQFVKTFYTCKICLCTVILVMSKLSFCVFSIIQIFHFSQLDNINPDNFLSHKFSFSLNIILNFIFKISDKISIN